MSYINEESKKYYIIPQSFRDRFDNENKNDDNMIKKYVKNISYNSRLNIKKHCILNYNNINDYEYYGQRKNELLTFNYNISMRLRVRQKCLKFLIQYILNYNMIYENGILKKILCYIGLDEDIIYRKLNNYFIN
tara:strand:+ start:2155 stop:2556 length:402 start_codon:yes stop_codon:yes gene_type:complete